MRVLVSEMNREKKYPPKGSWPFSKLGILLSGLCLVTKGISNESLCVFRGTTTQSFHHQTTLEPMDRVGNEEDRQ